MWLLRPLYRSAYISRHLQLRTGGFCWSKFYCVHALADSISIFSSHSKFFFHDDNNNHLTAVCPGQPGYAGTRRNIHPLTPILVNVLPLSLFSICNGPWHPLYSAYVLDSPLEQPLSRSSGLPLGLEPSTSYSMHFFTQSSSSFAAHAHTNAACSAAISMLCHLHLVSLSSLLGSLSFNLTPHIHLTILISAR